MLKKDNFIQKQFKIPGQKIGVIEEFLPEHDTYEKEGNIYTTRTGYALLNYIEKTVKIETNSGLDVLDEKDQLDLARRIILKAIPVSHTLDLEEINKYTNDILEIANKVEGSVNARQEEFIIRKKGLFAILVILILIIASLLFKRWVM